MGRPLHSLADAELTGYADRLTPKQRREREVAEKAALTLEQREEVARLDALIAQALQACEKGQTLRGGKRNPAFQNLATLVKTRKCVLDNARKQAKNKAPMDEIEDMLSKMEKPN